MSVSEQSKAKPLQVYHAGDKIIQVKDISFPGPRENCDFGAGFYVAANKQTAEEWVKDGTTPIINIYDFLEPQTNVLYLHGEDWIRVVVGFRTKAYRVNFKSPVICGAIADDRIDISLPLFMQGEIGDQRLLKCLDFCKFGDQYLFRESPINLTDVRSYDLKGQELQRARTRNAARKRDMLNELQRIRRQPIAGELYIEDYLARGDYIEP